MSNEEGEIALHIILNHQFNPKLKLINESKFNIISNRVFVEYVFIIHSHVLNFHILDFFFLGNVCAYDYEMWFL